MIANWLNETSLPRILAGAISAIYIGEIMEAMPTPMPPIMRYTTKEYTSSVPKKLNVSGLQAPMAEIKKATAAMSNPFFLPKDLEMKPAAAPPMTQPIKALAITNPLMASAVSCKASAETGRGLPIKLADQKLN